MTPHDVVKLAHDTIAQSELDDLADWIRTNPQLTKGGLTVEFERLFADVVGSEHAIFVNSGSSANLLVAASLMQSDRLRNKRVLCPAISWVTTVTPFQQLGFDVKLVDADPSNLGLNIDALEEEIRSFDPAVLVLVHVLGHPNSMERILRLCEEYDILLVEDTCEALGTVYRGGSWLGSLGIAGTFSFYYGHHISTVEGGMVVTDDDDLHQLMLSVRSHGWSRDLSEVTRGSLTEKWEIDEFTNLYTFYNSGFNLRPTDIQAKLGISQLARLEGICSIRQRNFHRYQENLSSFWSQSSDHDFLSSFAYGTLVENRRELSQELAREGIESRPLLCGNLGRHPFWVKSQPEFRGLVADAVHDYGIYFPNHANLDFDQIDRLCEIVTSVASPVFAGQTK